MIERIRAAEMLLVDRLFMADSKELLDWTAIYCPNPHPDGRKRDVDAMLRAKRDRLKKIAPIWR